MKNHLLALFFLTCFATTYGQTNVSGGIFSNTTWTLANSPYIVTDTIVVFPGVVLTIEPGVVVKFNDTKELEIRQGQLIANGTATDSITFTSNSLTPTPGIYKGLKINGGTMLSQFRYCNLFYSTNGIQNTATGSGFIIKHCTISSNVTGIRGFGSGNNSVLDSCVISYNTDTGVGEFDTIQNCRITNNLRGIQDGFTIYNCIIDSNTEYGVSANTGSAINCTFNNNGIGIKTGNNVGVNNCVFKHNNIALEPGTNYIIANCLIDSNSTGIKLGGWNVTWSFSNYVTNCIISNDSIGIHDFGPESFTKNTFTYNSIINNMIGIYLVDNVDSFSCNSICYSTNYNLVYTQSDNTSIMAHNYWCTSDSASTEALIYDAFDNLSLGIVNTYPIDSACAPVILSVPQNSFSDLVKIYPNPATDELILELPENLFSSDVRVYDVLGKMEQVVELTEDKTRIDLSALPAGIHLLQIKSGKEIFVKKIVKE